MEKRHILIEKANLFSDKRKENNLDFHQYDSDKGYWKNIKTDLASINDALFMRPATKKCDIETGEDKKGE